MRAALLIPMTSLLCGLLASHTHPSTEMRVLTVLTRHIANGCAALSDLGHGALLDMCISRYVKPFASHGALSLPPLCISSRFPTPPTVCLHVLRVDLALCARFTPSTYTKSQSLL